MKIKMCIFTKMISMAAISVIIGGAYISRPAYAAIDNTGCDDEYNLYINPDLALCSTHVYNIGKTENDSATRQLMQDVVALKTTLITQQMYSQYEILETTVKRLRTQLQKEVLLARLKSASAVANGGSYNDSSNGSHGSSNDKYVVLANAENCLDISGGTIPGLNCLIRNLDKVVSAVNSGNVGDAKKQLQKDVETAKMYSVTVKVEDPTTHKLEPTPVLTGIEECNNVIKQRSSKREDVSTCARKLRIAINTQLEDLNRSNNQQRGNSGY